MSPERPGLAGLAELVAGSPDPPKGPVKLTLRTLDPITIAWLLARAGAFIEPTRRFQKPRPAWGCEALSRNLKKSRKVIVAPWAIWRLLWKVAPDLARKRGDAYYVARLQRRLGEARRAAKRKASARSSR